MTIAFLQPATQREQNAISTRSLTAKLIDANLVRGDRTAGEEIGLRVNQSLTQDATGTLVMLALELLDIDRVQTDVSVQYVDHNIFQGDNRNPDDHLFLRSACRRFGVWYSGPGNGVSHPLHMQYFGRPGAVLAGSDSHTPAAGALGMLAFGAGGLDVAMAMAGEPLSITMPEVWGVRLDGTLPAGVSAKDVILELLRRHGVRGGLGSIIEYYGEGLQCLGAMDRHVIANMGTELGATSTVFPADETVRDFLRRHEREDDWKALAADDGVSYDRHDRIDLTSLQPLIALPSSPGNVVPVAEVAGRPIYQAYIGSSANPGFRDFAVAAQMVKGRAIAPGVSFDINPTSRQTLETLAERELLTPLLHAGARLHQAGCNGCIGMGQAPATGKNSLRTVPRNFSGRSGTLEDSVYLCSPETAAASAINGVITDPRDLQPPAAESLEDTDPVLNRTMFEPPPPAAEAAATALEKGPNIRALPEFEPLPDTLELPVVLCVEDDISTDEILPAGTAVLPYRSDVETISQFAFRDVDDSYVESALEVRDDDGHAIVGGNNYGQGSSREHAALAPRYLGLRMVLAASFARIHLQNLVNYGILPLLLPEENDAATPQRGDVLRVGDLREKVQDEREFRIRCGDNGELPVACELTERQRQIVLEGGLLNWKKKQAA